MNDLRQAAMAADENHRRSMRKLPAPAKKIKRLGIIYGAILGALMLTVISTPFLASRWIADGNPMLREQEVLQTLLIAVLLSLAFVLSRWYKKLLGFYRAEIQRLSANNDTLQVRLTDAFKYIGKVNVQLQEIRSIIPLLSRVPENRRDFKYLLRMFTQKAMTIANTDWVAVRIMDRPSLRTVIEHLESRIAGAVRQPHIGNKSIVNQESISGYGIVQCENKTLDIIVVFIFPREDPGWEEKILLEAIAGEIVLLFLTFSAMHAERVGSTPDFLPPSGRELPQNGARLEL